MTRMTTGGSCSFTNCLNNPIYAATLNPTRQVGCICPPTSEQTCQSPICPRKNHLSAAGSSTVSPSQRQGGT